MTFPSRFRHPFVALPFAACLFCHAASGDDAEPNSASDTQPTTTKINGVVESIIAHEISADTKHITTFELKRILPHGTKVKKGQNLVWFETEDIDKKIKEARIDFRLSKLTLDDHEFKYKQFLEQQELDRAAAERARKDAQQNYDNFVQVDRERQAKSAAFNLKSSRASLENALEELKQLEQMYKEDDLTEESEEIVLKRAKQSVEHAEFRLEGTEISTQRTIEQQIPRNQAQQEDSLAKAELAYQKSMRELDSARKRQDIEIGRKRDKLKEQEKDLAELKEERKQVVLTSPAEGIFLHGALKRGKLSEKPSAWKEKSKVAPRQVIGTVVIPSKLRIRVNLDEKHLALVEVGKKYKVTFNAFPKYETNGNVKSVSSVPYAGSKYDCVVKFQKSKQQPAILPTMTCVLEIETEAPPRSKEKASKDDKPETKKKKGQEKKKGKKKKQEQT